MKKIKLKKFNFLYNNVKTEKILEGEKITTNYKESS